MSGALTLAGVDPDTTPFNRWLGAVWAAYVQLTGNAAAGKLAELWRDTFHSEPAVHGTPDRDSWGVLPEHQAGQRRLMDGLGG